MASKPDHKKRTKQKKVVRRRSGGVDGGVAVKPSKRTYNDPSVPLAERVASVRRRIARRQNGRGDALHVLYQVLAGLLLLSDRQCGSHTDATSCATDGSVCHWLPSKAKRGWFGRRKREEQPPPGMCIGRVFHQLGMRTNPPSAEDIARIGKRHEALKAAGSRRPLLPEETEQLYVLDALQTEFQDLTKTMEDETAALRTVDDEIQYLVSELKECRRDSVRCPAAERTRLTKRLEKLWDERKRRSMTWMDVLKSQAVPVVSCLLRLASMTTATGGIVSVLGGASGFVGSLSAAQEKTTELLTEAGKWKDLMTALSAVGVAAGGALTLITAGPGVAAGAIAAGAAFVGVKLMSDSPTTAAVHNVPTHKASVRRSSSCCWPTGHRAPLRPMPLPVYATRVVDETDTQRDVCFFDVADLRRYYPEALQPNSGVDYVRLLATV